MMGEGNQDKLTARALSTGYTIILVRVGHTTLSQTWMFRHGAGSIPRAGV